MAEWPETALSGNPASGVGLPVMPETVEKRVI
jgi:hypothetical protein